MFGGPLQIIWGPAIYMILAALGLNQFKIIYHLLARFLSQSSSNPLWQQVQPAFRQQLTFFESIFGQPATFSPTVTHVLLVAIMLVLIVNLDLRRSG